MSCYVDDESAANGLCGYPSLEKLPVAARNRRDPRLQGQSRGSAFGPKLLCHSAEMHGK